MSAKRSLVILSAVMVPLLLANALFPNEIVLFNFAEAEGQVFELVTDDVQSNNVSDQVLESNNSPDLSETSTKEESITEDVLPLHDDQSISEDTILSSEARNIPSTQPEYSDALKTGNEESIQNEVMQTSLPITESQDDYSTYPDSPEDVDAETLSDFNPRSVADCHTHKAGLMYTSPNNCLRSLYLSGMPQQLILRE